MASPGTMSLTLQQPLNNIARLAIQMLACALGGGGQVMTTPLHDEAHALPSEEAIAVGAAIQQIVAHETGVADTIDPLAGSYRVEVHDAPDRGRRLRRDREDRGAWAARCAAIETGYFQRELAREQFERNRAIETGDAQAGRREPSARARASSARSRSSASTPTSEQRQIERLAAACARSATPARSSDGARRACARRRESGENLVPPILEAVKLYATQGEICDVLREVFGTYTPDSLTTGV